MGRITRNILPDLTLCGVKPDRPKDHRRHGRLRVQETECSIGYIENISCSGMSVSTSRKMKPSSKSIGLRLDTLDGPTTLPCKVIWARRNGFRKWIVGVEYTAMTLEQRKMLSQLARSVSQNECLRPEKRRAG